MGLDIRLLGPTEVSFGDVVVRSSALPGPIGRHLLTRLAVDPFPIGRDRLIDDLWDGRPPRAVESVLNATLSRLRSALGALGLDVRELVTSSAGVVNFNRPSKTLVDVELANQRIDLAARDIRHGELNDAARHAMVAYSISRRPLLPGIEREWLDVERDRILHVERRSLGVLVEVASRSGRFDEAVHLGREHVRIAPFDELAHRDLLSALAQLGDRSGALEVGKSFTTRLEGELGIEPSADFLQILASLR